MSDGVKRAYRSRLRAVQAEATRRTIVDAASRLFVERGYGATTVEAIADAAGVSRKTVFTAVGGKLDLLKIAIDWAVAGDARAIALQDRNEFRQLLELAEPRGLLEGWANLLVRVDIRVAALYQVLEVAASVDPAARTILEQSRQQRLAGARVVVERLAALGALRQDLDVDDATDVAWLAADPAVYDRLVTQRGWSTRHFEQWLARTLSSQLHGSA